MNDICEFFETEKITTKRDPISGRDGKKYPSEIVELHWCSHERSRHPKSLMKKLNDPNSLKCKGNVDNDDCPIWDE